MEKKEIPPLLIIIICLSMTGFAKVSLAEQLPDGPEPISSELKQENLPVEGAITPFAPPQKPTHSPLFKNTKRKAPGHSKISRKRKPASHKKVSKKVSKKNPKIRTKKVSKKKPTGKAKRTKVSKKKSAVSSKKTKISKKTKRKPAKVSK